MGSGSWPAWMARVAKPGCLNGRQSDSSKVWQVTFLQCCLQSISNIQYSHQQDKSKIDFYCTFNKFDQQPTIHQQNNQYNWPMATMLYLQARKERKKKRPRTEPNQKLQQKLRVSISDGVKQRLMEISSINNNLTQSRDWGLDEEDHIGYKQSFNQRYQKRSVRKDSQAWQGKTCTLKKIKVEEVRLKEVDRLRKLNKTECSVREQEASLKMGYNSITLQFQKVKEREMRIHSNGQVDIDFDNSHFKMSEKVFRQAANKCRQKGNSKNHLASPYMKKIGEAYSKRAPTIPSIKIASKAIHLSEMEELTVQRLRDKNIFKNDLSRKKQFIDLSAMLMQERRNIFYPAKANLSSKANKAQ